MKLSRKKILTYLATVALALVLTVTAVLGYAYFSKKEIYDGYLSGQVELLFDRLDDTGIANYQAAMNGEYGTTDTPFAPDKNATWGTKENPYVISNVRHLYNLSELQNIGYFHKQFISKNTDTDYSHIPYFLVCEPDYTPVLIDGSKFGDITEIGNDEYPFIGSVRGVHIETKDADGNPINQDEMITVGSERSATSVIHDVSVKGNPDVVDSGLFGYVSFLGTPPEEGSGETTFEGMPSTLSNLVLSDVTVSLKSTLWDAVTEFVKDIALGEGGHRYSFTELYGVTDANGNPLNIYDTVPHENHHIGILAGHVSYSIVEYISVFYSSDDIVAMDLSDANEVGGVKANYMSATGIIGFIYNLNPTINEDGTLTAGSGDSVSDLSYSMVGGGGEAVGDKAGYILAKNIFEKYTHIADQNGNLTENTADTIKISTATMADGTPLCYQSVRDMGILGEQIGYYFYDGVFTFALSTQEDVIEPTWRDNEIDQFQIGSTDRNNWVTNYTKGVSAIAAYASPVLSNAELQEAASKNKPIIILKDNGDSAFLMSLYTASQESASELLSGFNTNYTTSGKSLIYGTRDAEGLVTQLINSYNLYGQEQEFRDSYVTYTGSTMDADSIMAAVADENSGWKVFNVGSSSESGANHISELDELRNQFRVITTYNRSELKFFEGDKPLPVSNNTVSDYYDYFEETNYTGYLYYTTEWRVFYTNYTYYYQYEDGTIKEIATIRNGEPQNYQTNDYWRNTERIYSITSNSVTYTGVMVEMSNNTFYSSGNTAIISGPILLKPTGNSLGFFYKEVGTDHYHHATDSSTEYANSDFTTDKQTGTSSSGSAIYTVNGKTGILLDAYPTYKFSSIEKTPGDQKTANHLRMIRANFLLWGNQHAIWNGTDDAVKPGNFQHLITTARSVTDSTSATVKFNDDGTCYLQYAIDTTIQYVGYNGSSFNGAITKEPNTKLRIYVLEATQQIDAGRVTFDPVSSSNHFTFNANEHVLYTTANTDADNNTTTYYEVMDVTKLPNLGHPDTLGWKSGNAADGENGLLSGKDLTKKFHTEKGIQFGAVLNIGGFQLGTNGMITAPVGKLGTYADIPLGCVAFRVNKEGTQHVRVIISVSVSEYYVGETDGSGNALNDLGDSRRYFNMWKIEESGSETLNLFTKGEAFERFEIPMSHPYEPGTTSTDDSSTQGFYTVQYDSNGDGTPEDYGMFMNGDRILLAYEFTVDEVGLYILGPSGFNLDSNGIMENFEGPDVPMEIVYFSADGVASAGRDGASASQIGTIDYVYSYGGEIITVTDTSETESDGTEDYSTYYPSYVLTYFENTKKVDGEFISINNEKVRIRRYVATDGTPPTSTTGYNQMNSLSAIHYVIGGDRHANIVQYSRFCDNVIKEEE